MSKKSFLDSDGDGALRGDGEASSETSGDERDNPNFVYDSMEVSTLDDGDDVIELYDISAVLDRDGETEDLEATQARYPLAPQGRPSGNTDTTLEGVVDGNATIVDGGRALALARHQQTRHGALAPVEEVTPEVPPTSFEHGILAFSDPNHQSLSQFRILKFKVEEIIDQLQYRSLAICSSRRGEGTTSTALNLAVVMSENPWLKVGLLDLNFRKPDLGRLMRVPEGDPGLLHVLSGRVGLDTALKKLEHRNLYFLHTGGQYDASINILNSPQFDVLLSRLYESFDLILIDCPAVSEGDDALIIKQKVDGMFMVLRAQNTPVAELNRSMAKLGKDRILGVILNEVPSKEAR
jgi:Mrp family chromosome partitioning ATPase